MPVRTLQPPEEMRFLVAVAVQPLLAAALGFVAFPILLLNRNGYTLAGGSPANVADSAASVAAAVGLVALLVTILGGLPTALWLTKRRRIPLVEAIVFGLGFGNLPFVVGALTAGTQGSAGLVRGVAFSSLLGVAGAAVFWSIALRNRIHSDPNVKRPPQRRELGDFQDDGGVQGIAEREEFTSLVALREGRRI